MTWRSAACSGRRAVFTASLALLGVHCAAPPPAPVDRPTLAPDTRHDEPAASPGLRGFLTDVAGAPVAGATVMAYTGDRDDDPSPMTRTARDGSFRFEGLAPGSWRVTATSLQGLALHGDPIQLERPDQTIVVRLQLEPATHVLTGSVRDELGAPLRDATVTVNEVSARPGSMFGVVPDAEGNWAVGISTEAPYLLGAGAPGRGRWYARVSPNATSSDPIQLGSPAAERPSDAALTAWLKAEMKPIVGGRTGALEDMDPVGRMIGPAKIIALGEATHGSSEFQTLKHRILEHLVAREGVTVFAIEAGVMEALAIDDYVVQGKGSARHGIAGLQTFAWETEEMLDLVEWMRRWNADPNHKAKVRFEGFDVTAFSAVRALGAYLESVDPGVAANFVTATASLSQPNADATYPGLAATEQAKTRAALEHAQTRLEDRKRAYVARAGQPAWDLAMRQLAAAQQAEAVWRDPLSRDEAMATNVDAMIARHPAGTRVALWMHNSHASAERGRLFDMGAILRNLHGADYFVLGFAFGSGSFRAFGADDPEYVVRPLEVGDPVPEGFDAALGLAGRSLFAIDLRTAKDEVEAWLDSPLLAWNIGGSFADERLARFRVRPREAYDAVIYVDRVTASRPLPKLK